VYVLIVFYLSAYLLDLAYPVSYRSCIYIPRLLCLEYNSSAVLEPLVTRLITSRERRFVCHLCPHDYRTIQTLLLLYLRLPAHDLKHRRLGNGG
jgi:hypothetical protein